MSNFINTAALNQVSGSRILRDIATLARPLAASCINNHKPSQLKSIIFTSVKPHKGKLYCPVGFICYYADKPPVVVWSASLIFDCIAAHEDHELATASLLTPVFTDAVGVEIFGAELTPSLRKIAVARDNKVYPAAIDLTPLEMADILKEQRLFKLYSYGNVVKNNTGYAKRKLIRTMNRMIVLIPNESNSRYVINPCITDVNGTATFITKHPNAVGVTVTGEKFYVHYITYAEGREAYRAHSFHSDDLTKLKSWLSYIDLDLAFNDVPVLVTKHGIESPSHRLSKQYLDTVIRTDETLDELVNFLMG